MKSFGFKNFRKFKNLPMMDLGGINIFVGTNNSGKSTFIKGMILLLEDCEVLLSDRMDTGNHLLSTVLNLSDGILGDGLNIKFICTFNADITRLDKAILRKGRLKYKYEFTKLTPEKTQELAKELNKNIPEGLSLTVADIYNWEEDNGSENINNKRIGFND